MMFLIFASAGILFLSYSSVGIIRLWAEKKQLLALPNARSSHIRPTPRGGGLAIVCFTLLGLLLAYYIGVIGQGKVQLSVLWAYLVGASMIASISWLDDLYTLPNRWRFGVHSLSALLVIVNIGYWQTIALPVLGSISVGWLGLPITFIWITGLTNAYNFMDGIDGLAGSQAVIAGLSWGLFGWWTGQPFLLVVGCFIATSSLGFLGHNWAPAKIFMGDVGSAFLGFSFAVLAVVAGRSEPRLVLVGFLLVWPFVFDTFFTIVRRFRNGENIFTAHRSHLYQRLVITGHGHRTVTLLYNSLAGIGLLLSLAWFEDRNGYALTQLVMLPLLALGLWLLVINQEQWKMRVSTLSSPTMAIKTSAETNGAKVSPIRTLQGSMGEG